MNLSPNLHTVVRDKHTRRYVGMMYEMHQALRPLNMTGMMLPYYFILWMQTEEV